MTATQFFACLFLIGSAPCGFADPSVTAAPKTSATNPIPMIQVRFLDENGHPGPLTSTPIVTKTDAEWRKQLTGEQYRIARGKGTEPAFCGAFFDNKKPGVYICVC